MSEASPLPQPVSSPATLGGNLRRARLERGLSLRALARELDVSPSLVSQIETGRNQPSVRTLYAMVSKLGVSLDDVFQLEDDEVEASAASDYAGAAGNGIVQRAGDRSAIDLETGVRWERLTTHDVPGVEFLYIVYPPGSESSPAAALVRHGGRELGYVCTGELGVTLGFEQHVLGPGDSISFDSTMPHRLHNDGDEVVTAVWIVLGRHA
jgi:transcriptional regulator with XRE-family HTH domain